MHIKCAANSLWDQNEELGRNGGLEISVAPARFARLLQTDPITSQEEMRL